MVLETIQKMLQTAADLFRCKIVMFYLGVFNLEALLYNLRVKVDENS